MEIPELRHIACLDKKEIGGLLYVAYEDYVSARILLLSGSLMNGCILANTSLEKLLKALIFYCGENNLKKYQHRAHQLLDDLNKKGFKPNINREFLSALSMIYDSRYIGDNNKVKPGYNFTIVKNKFLAELDYTVDLLGNTIVAKSKPKPNVKTAVEICNLNRTNPQIRNGNYLYLGMSKDVYCTGLEDILELRVLSNYETIIWKYQTLGSKNDGKFSYETLAGIDRKTPGESYANPTHKPINETVELEML